MDKCKSNLYFLVFVFVFYIDYLFIVLKYLKRYQKRWFVLQAGILAYYRSRDEVAHTCRGTVYLESAHLSSTDACNFILSNGSITMHLRTSTETDKQRWMNALESAKQKALKARKYYQDSDDDDDDDNDVSATDDYNDQKQQQQTNVNDQTQKSKNMSERTELMTMNRKLETKLDKLNMCMDLVNRHYQALHRATTDLEHTDKLDLAMSVIKSTSERATLFRIASTGKHSIL